MSFLWRAVMFFRMRGFPCARTICKTFSSSQLPLRIWNDNGYDNVVAFTSGNFSFSDSLNKNKSGQISSFEMMNIIWDEFHLTLRAVGFLAVGNLSLARFQKKPCDGWSQDENRCCCGPSRFFVLPSPARHASVDQKNHSGREKNVMPVI